MEQHSGRRAVLIVLIAVAVVSAAIAAYVLINEKPPAAGGSIDAIHTSAVHSQMRVGEGAKGLQGGLEVYDQLFVVAQVTLRSQGQVPLFLHDFAATLTTSDGAEQRSLGATVADFGKVFLAYPQLAQFKGEPIQRDTTIPAGGRVSGLMIFHFPLTQKDWDTRQGFRIQVGFTHQKDLVLETTAPKQ